MIATEQRRAVLRRMQQACGAGAHMHKACALIGLVARSVQRWPPPQHDCDGSAAHKRAHTCPANQLSDAERSAARDVLDSEEFRDLPPRQIVPRLGDKGQ